MNKFIHEPSVAGQSLADRVMAAKHTITRDVLAKAVFKATTDEVVGPKRKHLDYLIWCTNVPDVSIPDMARYLMERTQATSWVVVFKALVTTHDIMNYGNERFTQFLASNRLVFHLESFNDRTSSISYDMSVYIRRYAKYLNAKAQSYRKMGYDFCKVKRGKEDGFLRVIDISKLMPALPVLQLQLDALLEFNASAGELNNGVINVCYIAMFKDLIRLFACYNDGIINLLEKFFEMDRANCAEAINLYKKFVARMDKVKSFLQVAKTVGYDRKDIPDLAKVPDGLSEALEEHLKSLEHQKKSGSTTTTLPKPAGMASAISKYTAAAQLGIAPGAGKEGLSISEEERVRILAEEQRQLDLLKAEKRRNSSSIASTKVSSDAWSPAPTTFSAPPKESQAAFIAPFESPPSRPKQSANSLDFGFDPWAAPSLSTTAEQPSNVAKPPTGFSGFDVLQPMRNETTQENGTKPMLKSSMSLGSAWNQPLMNASAFSMQTPSPLSPTYVPMQTMGPQMFAPRPMFTTPTASYSMTMGGQYWNQPGTMMVQGPTPAGAWALPGLAQPVHTPQAQTVAPNDPFGPL